MGGREVSRPYRVFRRETASGFYPFDIAKRLFFYVFCFGAPSIYSQNRVNRFFIADRKNRSFGVWEGVGEIKKPPLKGGFW